MAHRRPPQDCNACKDCIALRRRVYHVDGPNCVWHIDGHQKLIRWGIVTHAGIDRYSVVLPPSKCNFSTGSSHVANLLCSNFVHFCTPTSVQLYIPSLYIDLLQIYITVL